MGSIRSQDPMACWELQEWATAFLLTLAFWWLWSLGWL